jgi:hypothetical protein
MNALAAAQDAAGDWGVGEMSQALARAVVDHDQDAHAAAINELVGNEVDRLRRRSGGSAIGRQRTCIAAVSHQSLPESNAVCTAGAVRRSPLIREPEYHCLQMRSRNSGLPTK